MPAAVAIVGAVASAGAAMSAVGAIAAAGTAALTVGSIASIATFVGSVTSVVGLVTDDENLMRVGGVLALAGGVTSVAANGLKLFGESQTLSASLETANVLSEAAKTAANGATLDFSMSGSSGASDFGVQLSGDALNQMPGGPSDFGAVDGLGSVSDAAQTASTANAMSAAGETVSADIDFGLLRSKGADSAAFNNIDLGTFDKVPSVTTPTVDAPDAPSAGGGDTDGFSFSKFGEFVNSDDGKAVLNSLSGAYKGVVSMKNADSLEKLRAAQSSYYDTQRGLIEDRLRNASAAGRLYGGV